MKKVRRTVTLDAELVRELRELSDEPLSAIVEDALRAHRRHLKLEWMRRQPIDPRPVTQEAKDAIARELAELWES